MKKLFLMALIGLIPFCANGQTKVIVKSGTVIPFQAVNNVKAADVNEGSLVDFRVSSDVKIDGVVVIPQGTISKGRVTEAKKSTVAGTKGRLTIELTDVALPNGEKIYFSSTFVRIYGKNRTPLAVVTGLFIWPCIFIPGTRAEMPSGYEVQAYVSANTEVTVN